MDTEYNLQDIENETGQILDSFFEQAEPKEGQLLVIGGSSSEVRGGQIGQLSSAEIGETIIATVVEYANRYGLYLAVQCCEHLNRALVIDESYALSKGLSLVNAKPIASAGGSFATAYWNYLEQPALAEEIKADLGIDIGDSFIGMHLKPVAVPLRLSRDSIGQAHVTAAKSRLKLIGGKRAQYQE